jgi:hypothetical protein
MKKNYTAPLLSFALLLSITTVSCAQSPKVKTITIINGDTTITESNIDEKEFAKMEKEIDIQMNGGNDSSKKIVKKMIINDEKGEGQTMAYAYSIDEPGEDVEVISNENGSETRIIIRKGDDKDEKGKKTIVKKSVSTSADGKEKHNLNVNIRIKDTNANVEVETSSKTPLNISVLDENGKQVFYDTHKTGGKYSKEIPLGKKGTYFLNLIQDKSSTSEKIVIE